MDNTKEYYELYLRTFWALISSIGWKEVAVALFSLLFGSVYYVITKGWGAMIDQAVNFIVYTLAPLVFLASIFILSKLIETPVKIYTDLKIQASKQTSKDVKIIPRPFIHRGNHVAGLQIHNGKPIDLLSPEAYVTYFGKQGETLSERDELQLPWLDANNNYSFNAIAKICAGGDEMLVIARTIEDAAIFDAINIEGKHVKIELEPDLEYYMELRINATIEDRVGFVPPPPRFSGKLIYTGSEITIVLV